MNPAFTCRCLTSFALSLLVVLAGCSGSAVNVGKASTDSLFDQFIQKHRDFYATLPEITDEASAKKMLPKLEGIYDDMLGIAEQMRKVNGARLVAGTMPNQEFEDANKKMREAMKAVNDEFGGHQGRLRADSKIEAVLKPLWDRIASGPIK